MSYPDPPPPADEEEIFQTAATLAQVERASYLDLACAERPEIRARVERLLARHDEPTFMRRAADRTLSPETEDQLARLKPEEPGERIDDYKLLEKIGEGGFGTVWVADQEQPVRRRVALKIIKLGMDTRDVIARFEQERQALAMMDHPHIAKVLDAGATQWGRPYFVMELVRGIKITDYCDQANLPTAERLALFIQVCNAVQHAHQKGIIHRDLKPSNILVTLHDGVPVPKVIDFGVAKATQQQRLTDLTVYTQFEQMIGTPLYMSPEQAEMSGLDVDTRSDIYSLGVLLYELLTGRTPFDPEELLRKGVDEIRRSIREQEPKKPSTFLSTMAFELRTNVAQHRQVEGAKLVGLIRGDLDWIVMKALEKDRTRRYDTANGLAKDIERHLGNEPVNARPASQLYRFRRLVRRNRMVFAAAGAVAAALVIGLSTAVCSYLNERTARAGEAKQRSIAEEGRRQAQSSAREATTSELKARRSLYAANISLAQQSLRANNLGRARLLLDGHRPADGELDLRNWEWRYLWQECRSGALASLTKREGIRAFSVSFSPDGRSLAVGFFDGQVELWDVVNRKLVRIVQERTDQDSHYQRSHVTFSPDGQVLAATGGGLVKTCNVQTGAEVLLGTVKGWVRDVSYSADGELLAVLTGGTATVQVWRAGDGQMVMNYPLPTGSDMHFNNARLSPDKQRLYVSGGMHASSVLKCLSVPEGRVLWEIPMWLNESSEAVNARDTGFSAMSLSPDGLSLAVGTGFGDPLIRVLDAQTGQLVRKLAGHTGWIFDLAFSRDGRMLASASSDQTLQLWDTASWTKQTAPLRGHGHEVQAVAFSGDGRFLASGSKDGEVLLWDVQASRPVNGRGLLPRHIVQTVALPGGQSVLGQTAQGKWSVVDLPTFAEEPLPTKGSSRKLPGLVPERVQAHFTAEVGQLGLRESLPGSAISNDGKLLALAALSGFVGLYHGTSLKEVARLRGNMDSVFGVAFSPDCQRLVSTGIGAQAVALWDLETRQELLVLTASSDLLTRVEFSGDGNTLFAASLFGDVARCRFWKPPSWAEIAAAEDAGGRWGHGEGIRPAPAQTLGETKVLLEEAYRKKLAEPRTESFADRLLRTENLKNFARFLQGEGRADEAEPFFQELLGDRRRRIPPDHNAFFSAAEDLIGNLILQQRSASEAGDSVGAAKRAAQAEALIAEHLGRADELARTLWSSNTLLTLHLAALHAWLGRDADHLSISRHLIERAEQNADHAADQERAAKAWCAVPSDKDPALLQRALRLAQQVAELDGKDPPNAWFQMTLGTAEYRSGNFAAAEAAMLRAEAAAEHPVGWDASDRPLVVGPARLVRAMILSRQGQAAEAQRLFSQAEAQMKPLPSDVREGLTNGASGDDLIVWLIYREAKGMLAPAK